MTLNEKDRDCYIVDVGIKDGLLCVTRANGEEYVLPYSEHNLNSIRFSMVNQVKKYSEEYMFLKGKECFDLLIGEVRAFICGIFALFFLYNFDVHIIIKIILTIVLVFSEIFYSLVKLYDLCMLGDEYIECECLDTYVKNIDVFSYVNSSQNLVYRLPIEELSKCNFSKVDLEKFVSEIKAFKSQGIEDEDISLDYKKLIKENNTPKTMI